MTTEVSDQYLTPVQVCEWLNVEKAWIYDQVQQRKIPFIKLGRQLRFNRAELEIWIKEQSQ